MKKTVLTWGLLGGALSIATMLATVPFMRAHDMGKAELLGYTSIVLSALLVFFGVRSYRQNAGAGRMTFLRGLAVGALITLVTSACYVATWELLYFKLMPDLRETLAACMVQQARDSGGTPEEVDAAVRRVAGFQEMFDDPLTNAALTLAEPLPVGLLATAISAAILRKK